MMLSTRLRISSSLIVAAVFLLFSFPVVGNVGECDDFDRPDSVDVDGWTEQTVNWSISDMTLKGSLGFRE